MLPLIASYVLALLVIAMPWDGQVFPVSTDQFDRLREPLRTLCERLEILDRRERSYILADKAGFDDDVRLLRRRLADLNDAPQVSDADRLPQDKVLIGELLFVNREYRMWLVTRRFLDCDRDGVTQETIEETDYLYLVWDAMRDAVHPEYYVTVRRQALKRLRGLVGDEAYYSGQLPPTLPVWRMPRL